MATGRAKGGREGVEDGDGRTVVELFLDLEELLRREGCEVDCASIENMSDIRWWTCYDKDGGRTRLLLLLRSHVVVS